MTRVLLLFTKTAVSQQKANPTALCDLLNHAGKATHTTYEFAFYEDLLHVIGADEAYILNVVNNTRLDAYDFVYQRRWGELPEQAMACAMYLRNADVPFMDKESDRSGSLSKLTQYWRLWEHDLPFPKTAFVPSHSIRAWIDKQLETVVGLPCIMKSDTGTRGGDNYLVHSLKDAQKIVEDNPTVNFLMQQFIPNDGDYRVLVTGDSVGLLIFRTAAAGTHTNNTSQGGAADLRPLDELPQAARKACIRAAQVFDREFAGVDLVFDKRHPESFYFFEVNRAPQVEESSFSSEKAAMLDSYINHRASRRSK